MFESNTVLWVAGGRDLRDSPNVRDRLDAAMYEGGYDVLVTGAARGADTVAENWWRFRQFPYVGIPAMWSTHGKRAGYLRNEVIAKNIEPDALLALPGGRGTQHARDLARQYEIPILD
jgi:hypothetical protein